MPDLSEALKAAQQQEADLDALIETATQAKKDAWNGLRDDLLAGGVTTGDRIADYVIVKYGHLNKTEQARYQAVEEKLSGMTGELVLVFWDVQETAIYRMMGGNTYHTVRRYYLGILTDDRLELTFSKDGVGCELPVARYADQKANFKIEKKPIQEGLNLFHQRIRFDLEHLVVGDEAVKEWVRIRELGFWVLTEGKFESLVEKLGRLVLKPAPEEPAIE